MADGRTHTPPSADLVRVRDERQSLAEGLADPRITLARGAATYILFKRRRLTPASERGYQAVLDEFTLRHPGALLRDFEPPNGTNVIDDFLTERWGHLAERTYNKSHSILCDFFSWHVNRGTLDRDPMGTIERAKTRPVHRTTFSADQRQLILAASPDPSDQIALGRGGAPVKLGHDFGTTPFGADLTDCRSGATAAAGVDKAAHVPASVNQDAPHHCICDAYWLERDVVDAECPEHGFAALARQLELRLVSA